MQRSSTQSHICFVSLVLLSCGIALSSCGYGKPPDLPSIRRAADQGDAVGQANLGVMYAKGEGVAKDYGQAVKWRRKAADQGDAEAQTNVGLMYETGKGVPKDYVQSYMWYNLAGQSDTEARKSKDRLATKMTPQQIAKARKLSREWKPKTGSNH